MIGSFLVLIRRYFKLRLDSVVVNLFSSTKCVSYRYRFIKKKKTKKRLQRRKQNSKYKTVQLPKERIKAFDLWAWASVLIFFLPNIIASVY